MMDGGVGIKGGVGGIGMGVVKCGEQQRVLREIEGMEDGVGDMEFKVGGR